MEVWKEFPEDPRYLVSSAGRVYSTISNKILKFRVDRDGYLKGFKDHKAHQMVMSTFVGIRPEGFTVNHIDGNKQNNRLSNLEYVSRTDNVKHGWYSGLMVKGEDHHWSKLTKEQVDQIRSMYTGERGQYTAIARLFGISRKAVFFIIKGVTWK